MNVVKFKTREELAFAELVAEAKWLHVLGVFTTDEDDFGDIESEPGVLYEFPNQKNRP